MNERDDWNHYKMIGKKAAMMLSAEELCARLQLAERRIAELEAELDWHTDAEYAAVERIEHEHGVRHV